VEADAETKRLKLGDTARYQADVPHAVRNTGKSDAKALLIVIHG
jgi:XRE family transcriptional regulator, regulator of sulfur utilization